MDRETNVMDKEIVEVGVKTNIVDERLDVFYHPTFYNKQQAYDILQQLKTETVSWNSEGSGFIPKGLSLNSGYQVATGDKESTLGKPIVKIPWSPILMKIRDDIVQALGIRFNLCLVD